MLTAKFENAIYKLAEDTYEGTISSIKLSNGRFLLSIKLKNSDEIFKTTFNSILTPEHPLTKLILLSGVEIEEIEKFDLESLKDTDISFDVVHVAKHDKTFYNTQNFDIL